MSIQVIVNLIAAALEVDDFIFAQALRVRLKTFEGHPFVSIQLWKASPDGSVWPVKGRSTSIRLGELVDVIEGLQMAVDATGRAGRQQDRAMREDVRSEDQAVEQTPRFVDKGRAVRPPWEPDSIKRMEGSAGFDEFV